MPIVGYEDSGDYNSGNGVQLVNHIKLKSIKKNTILNQYS